MPEGAPTTPPPGFVDTIPVGEGAAEAGDTEREGRRRRRRRGGRRDDAGSDATSAPIAGRESSTGPEGVASVSPSVTQAMPDIPTDEVAAPPRERERARREERGATPALDIAIPESSAALPTARDASTAAATATPAPRIVPPVPHFELPTHELQQLADGAGLQWVNSDADKVRSVQQAIAAEPQPPHVPRERKPVVLPDEGPLVLVETRKDLSQFALPFERQATPQAQPPQ